jgi:uncharacterized alpha-E superfamily protein
MLARVAENLYWLGRHLERAENAARMAHVEYLAAVESGEVGATSGSFWEPLVKASGAGPAFAAAVAGDPDLSPAFYLILSDANPNSVRSSVIEARSLARAGRELISREVWEELNELHLTLQARTTVRDDELYDLCREVKRSVETIIGLFDHTVLRDEGGDWFRCGLYIERADMTSRILDTKYHVLLPSATEVGGPLDRYQWMAILRSASAWEAFRKVYRTDITGPRVAEMLIFEAAFPRSLVFCVRALGEHFRRATALTPGTQRLPVESVLTLLELRLGALTIDRVIASGLHEFLDSFQSQLIEVQTGLTDHIFRAIPESVA